MVENMIIPLLLYLLVINLAGYALFGVDKRRAIRHRWRIPENDLLLTAILGGSLGCIAGMLSFHHKTLHPKFRYGLPVILIIQIILFLWLWNMHLIPLG